MSGSLRNRLADLGIDPRLSAAEIAAMLVREIPLRAAAPAETDPASIVENRWCPGVSAWTTLMEALLGVPARWGSAFGCPWPRFEIDGAVTAPAMPVRLAGPGEERGPDGVYAQAEDSVIREAAGRTRAFWTPAAEREAATPRWDLLWFSDTARWSVSRGVLTVEDLFSTATCPVDRARLERLLVRSRRVDPSVLEGLVFDPGCSRSSVEVVRAAEIDRLPEPDVFLAGRMDVESTQSRGGSIDIVDVRHQPATFTVDALEDGYRLILQAGTFLFDAFEVRREGVGVHLKAQLSPERDLFKPGLRERLVFDLHADLAACLD